MGALDRSVATLRLFGDALVPDEISALLGAAPTNAHRKGEELVGRATGNVRIAKTGMWRLSASDRKPEDLEAQVFEILGQLSQDLNVWKALSSQYELDFFCGLFMSSGN